VIGPDTTILLIGLRGSGKTTIAGELARRMGRPAVDLDGLSAAQLREETAGEAIRNHGEAAFRRAELAALVEAMSVPGRVLALGGGTPTAPGVEELLRSAGKRGEARVVYLRATEPTLRARLEAELGTGADRPSLTGKGSLEEIGVLLNLRDTLYKSVADIVIEVDGLDVARVAEEVVRRL